MEKLTGSKRRKIMSQQTNKDEPPDLPLKDSSTNAYEYFSDVYFFLDESMRNLFLQRCQTKAELTQKTLHEFFEDARKTKEFSKMYEELLYCRATKAEKAYKKWDSMYPSKRMERSYPPRMVSIGFQIQSTKLSHLYDLKLFSERIQELFKWWNEEEADKKLVGPYMCIVQSSGMGKTKLIYEYKMGAREKGDVGALMILPMKVDVEQTEEVEGVFDCQLDLTTEISGINKSNKEAAKEAAGRVYALLDEIIKRGKVSNFKKIVLMFDESHTLLKEHFGFEAFLFRCVRLWLREKRSHHIVGVFAGTNPRLSNFLVERDDQFNRDSSPSREHQRLDVTYIEKGVISISPFFYLSTIGSCLDLWPKKDPNASEYAHAIYYGRPLFAVMDKDDILNDKSPMVLSRMLLLDNHVQEWDKNRNTWINLLATRVQMGQTTMVVTSELVGKGYANLCGCFEESVAAQLSYLPDPVCARLAMCMMDENFTCTIPATKDVAAVNVGGKDKQWWTEKLTMIFSSGVVSPEKGDFGEVVVALYMLWCADVLRKTSNYNHFSVSLDDWFRTMQLGGRVPKTTSVAGSTSKVSVGFIQVCRNSLRSYEKSWIHLTDQSFLKHVYESGTAFYVFQGCPLIDLVIPLRIENGKDVEFVPMLVSIKCRASFRPHQVKHEENKLMEQAKRDGVKKAVCLLIIFGSESSDQKDPTVEVVSNELTTESVVVKTIRVPANDDFQLSEAYKNMTPAAAVDAELFASHPFILAHGCDANSDNNDNALTSTNALRRGSPKALLDKFGSLCHALIRPNRGRA